MALNLGRMRGDNTGSQDTILNSIKPQKTAFPRFTGKNADELNTLALFIEDKIASANEYGKDLTSKNVDTTLERMHTLMLKLKDASDSDNTTAYEKLQGEIIAQVKELMVLSESDKPKEVLLSEEDKEYIKELIAASTLTEATEKTEDLSGENGLTQDDINKALDKTIALQKVLNNDVVAAAEKANTITEDAGSSSDDVKAELAEMFKDGSSDEAIDDMSKTNATQFQKLQDLINGHVGRLNSLFGTFGDNFKNSPLFNYKNPFTSSVGKIPSVLDELSTTLTASAPKTVELSLITLQEIFRGVHNVVLSVMKKSKKKKQKPLPAAPIAAPVGPVPPLSSKEKKEKKKTSKLFDSIGKFMKKINDIIKNIVLHVLDIISLIVIGLCKAIAKGIGIILRAIFLSPWGLIILASLLLISVGILLISLAVKKLVDYIVDDLGPIIKEKLKMINPEALNNFLDKVSKFIDVFSSILAGAFAPLIVIGTIIKNAIGPLAPVIKTIAETLAKILVPVVKAIGEVVMILMKPILLLLKMVALAIQKLLMVMMPIFQAVLDLIVNIYKFVIKPLYLLALAIIVPILKIIGALIQGIIKIVLPLFELFMTILMPAIDIIVDIVKGIIEIVKPIVEFLMVVLKAAIDIIVTVVQAIMAIVLPILDVIMGVIKIVVLGILTAVKVIQKVVGFIRNIIRKIFNAFMHPIKFVTSLIKGIGNWLAKFADFEIGFWKFKFKPLSFLKGLKSDDTGSGDVEEKEDTEDEGKKEVKDTLKEQIEELNKKMEQQVKTLETIHTKFNQAMTVAKPLSLYMFLRTKLNAKILDDTKVIIEDMSDKFSSHEEKLELIVDVNETANNIIGMLEQQAEMIETCFDTGEIISKLDKVLDKLDNEEVMDKLDDIIDLLKMNGKFQNTMFGGGKFKSILNFVANAKKKIAKKAESAAKTAFGFGKKVAGKAGSIAATAFKFTPLGFAASIAAKVTKSVAGKVKKTDSQKTNTKKTAKTVKSAFYNPKKKNYTAGEKSIFAAALKFMTGKMSSEAKQAVAPPKTDIKIAPQSVQAQFLPIQSVSSANSNKMKNVASDLEDIKAEEASSRKNKDITNMDLKNFLTAMFENIDENFFQINKKLDEPNLMPMPMSMNINNLALLGAN